MNSVSLPPYTISIDAFRLTTEKATSGFYFVRNLANALIEHDGVNEVVLLLPRQGHQRLSCLGVVESPKLRVSYPRKPHFPERSFPAQILWTQWAIPALFRSEPTASLLMMPYHQTPIFLGRDGRTITFIHDLCGLRTDIFPRWKKAFNYHLLMFWTAIVGGDLLVPISEFTRSELISRFPIARRKTTPHVWNCVDAPTMDASQARQVLESVDIHPHTYFLCFAAPGRRKGFDQVLSAYVQYRERGGTLDLVVVTSPDGQKFVNASLPQSGAPVQIRTLVRVPDTVRDALYWGASAFLFMTRCEGFGYPVVEALRQGCPVVTPPAGPAAEILQSAPLPAGMTWDSGNAASEMLMYERVSAEDRRKLSQELRTRSEVFAPGQYAQTLVVALQRILIGSSHN